MVELARGGLPPKPYYRIGEVAELVGVEPHVLRYWEREFRAIRPTKSAKGQRVYSRRDVETLVVVRGLLYDQGFTIAGAKRKLQETRPPRASEAGLPTETRDQLLALRADIEAFLAEIGGADVTRRPG
jgi:DNA-binding transcriptional MerR regulator